MSTMVYQFGLLPPVESEGVVRAQMRAAHDYQNDLVAIERGRRAAMRALHETDAVGEAVALVKAATRSSRKSAMRALSIARAAATRAAGDEVQRIKDLDASIRRDARALTPCYWGSYLTIEASADQTRKSMPIYGDDAVTPNDPRFRAGPRWREALSPGDPRGAWWRADAQIGIQLQGGLPVHDALAGKDRRLRLTLRPPEPRGLHGAFVQFGDLWLRVGTADGRAPLWARWPIKLHRALPDAGILKWARVSVRADGFRERWSCELTVEVPSAQSREAFRAKDRALHGAVAIELAWIPKDDGSMIAAFTLDDDGHRDEVVLPPRIVNGIRKPNGIRAVRDLLLNDLRPTLARSLRETKEALPAWLREAAATLHLWKSPVRFHRLVMRWREEVCDAARPAYELLDAWAFRDRHLYDYETGARRTALRYRREFYRVFAVSLARRYRAVLLPDRDFSREARFGEDSDVRFLASPFELRNCLAAAFASDAVKVEWRGKHGVRVDEEDEDADAPDWLAFAIERWQSAARAVTAREEKTTNDSTTSRGGAWAKRKKRKEEIASEKATAREAVAKATG